MILSRFSVTSSLIYDFLSKSDRKVSFFQSKEGLKPRPGFLSGLRRHNKRIKLKDYVGSSTLPGRYTAAEVRFQLYLHCFCSLMTEWNKEKEHKQAKRTYQNIIFLKLTEELSRHGSIRIIQDSFYLRQSVYNNKDLRNLLSFCFSTSVGSDRCVSRGDFCYLHKRSIISVLWEEVLQWNCFVQRRRCSDWGWRCDACREWSLRRSGRNTEVFI